MRRKLLSVVLCVCMMMTMAPFAFAEGESIGAQESVVAKIGDQEYSTLQAAINAATTGQTIQLVADTTDATSNSYIIQDGKELNLDLNGKHLTLPEIISEYFIIKNGKLTITDTSTEGNGEIIATKCDNLIDIQGSNTSFNFEKGTIVLNGYWSYENIKYGNTAVLIRLDTESTDATGTPSVNFGKDAKIVIANKSGDDTIYPGWAIMVNGIAREKTAHYGATVDVYGQIINGGLYVNGTVVATQNTVPVFNVYDGAKIDGQIYAAGYAKWNISGGDIKADTGMEIRAGELNMTGGSLVGTATPTSVKPNGNGGTSDGVGLAIAQHTTRLPISVNISSGTISGFTGLLESNPQNGSSADIEKINVSISGGNFTASNGGTNAAFSEDNRLTITGGTFSSDVSAYVADGYIQTESGTVEALNANNAVAKINDTYYKTLASAVAAAESDATVTLLKNTKEKVTVSQNLTVDLGGHTLTGSDLTNGNGKPERVAFTANAGNVTIQNGIIDGRVNAYDASNLTVAADLTIKNGYNGEGYDCFGIVVWGDAEHSKTPKLTLNGKVTLENGGIALSTNGTDMSNAEITINNSAIVSSNEDAAIYLPSGKLIMNGGTISGPTGIQICAGNANITSEFQLNGGTVTATGTDMRTSKGTGDGLIPDGAAISIVNRNYPNGVPSVTINSGSFSSVNNDAILAYTWSNGAASTWEDAASRLSISGGYFTTDPTSYLAAEHYTVASNKDGYSYMVTTTEPTKAPVIVKDATDTALAPSITDENTKTEIQKVINKANVDGTAESIKDSGKSAIINAAGVTSDEQNNKNNKITIDVKVTITATAANLTNNSATSSITFSAAPVATVTVNNGTPTTGIPVSNDYLNGKEITVKLPLPENFTPKQIKHISSDNSVEYFLDHPERGAKTFDVEDGCAVFTINKFSTFVVSGTQDYVAPSSGSSSGSTSYAVNVNAATNGAVAADKKTASKGTTVTVTASPSKGYVVDAVKVVDKDGKDVAVTGKDGKYVFTMPASAVTVTGSFKAETPAPVALPFTDVKSGNWFYDAVKYAYEQGLMTGTSATTFAPNGTMNRAMIVTVLYRLEKSPAVTGASKFTDVPAGQWYSDAVAWAAANKIVNGYDETTFGPMNAVTREQMAAILFRYEQVKGLENVTLEENLNRFPDQNKISAYAIPALQWAVGQKIINGNADGTLDPTGTATRAQVAQIFTNLLNK